VPLSRPSAHLIHAGRYLVPRTFLLARGVRALSAVDLDGGAPVLLVPLPASAQASPPDKDAAERWNRHAPPGSARALGVARHAGAAMLVVDATSPPTRLRVRSPADGARRRAEASAIGASLDAAGLTLPDACAADLAIAGDRLCLARPAVPAVAPGPLLATLLPLLVPEPSPPQQAEPPRAGRVRGSPRQARRRSLTLAAAIAACAVGYVIVGAALPQRSGVEPARAARAVAGSERTMRPAALPAASRVEPEPGPREVRGGPARALALPQVRARPAAPERAPVPAKAPGRASAAVPARPEAASAHAPLPVLPVLAARPELPLAPTIPS
jgi:hypothetical protein